MRRAEQSRRDAQAEDRRRCAEQAKPTDEDQNKQKKDFLRRIAAYNGTDKYLNNIKQYVRDRRGINPVPRDPAIESILDNYERCNELNKNISK